ncbi:MAG TPA: hypothetical protein VHM91_24270, partial [Verrucomicrobiales bacterium]|nr:hypothetical protein [Verrucomicrobiales bacterium]
MNENVYQPPSASISPPAYSAEEGAIPPAAMEHLIGTQPWAGITGIIGLITTILSFGPMIYFMALLSQLRNTTPALLILLLVAYLIIHALIRLCRYALAISRLRTTQSEANFGKALHQQRLFWRFVGVLTLIFVLLFLIG